MLLGGVVGVAELVTRYRDSPRRLIHMISFHAYWLGNGLVACLALLVLHNGLVSFSAGGLEDSWLAQCLFAGFGSMLLLRSSFLILKDGNQDRPVGLSAGVDALLDFFEETVRRNQATARAAAVRRLMSDLPYQRALADLPSACISLMAQASSELVDTLTTNVSNLQADDARSDDAKLLELGAALIQFCGEDVLRGAIGMTFRQDSPDRRRWWQWRDAGPTSA
jgi:hypothetical protein